jgi:hypothetical protein
MDDRPTFRTRGYKKKPLPKLQVDEVVKLLREEHGLLSRVAERLGTTRSALRQFVFNRARVALVLKECREELGDIAEKSLYDLIIQHDFRAISFYLSTMCQNRGYALPKGAALAIGDTNYTIQSVNIMAVPSGTFLPPDPDAKPVGVPFLRVIEGDPPDTQLN